MSVRAALRAMLKSGEPIVAPGAHDAITALVAQHLGFKAIYMGGYMTGAHLATTEPLMTLTEQVANASWVVKAVKIPLICDADAGFGDAVHTMRCVREFEYAGVAAIHIEDQVFPKRASYHRGLEHVIPRQEFITKMKMALAARQDPDFIIIGRIDAARAAGGSMEECIARGHALAEIGVDVLMPLLMENKDREKFRKEVPHIPLLGLSTFGGLSVKQFQDLGYQIIIYPISSIAPSVAAVLEVDEALKQTGVATFDEAKIARARQVIEEVIGLPEYYKVEDETTERSA